MKTCAKCKEILEESNFYRHKENKDGLQARCKQCTKEAVLHWQIENKKKVNNKVSLWKRKTKAWSTPAAKSYCNSRAAARRTQTPSWANLKEIRQVYLNCPSGFHVDHIIPLRGKRVSGLHIETNLQYLPARDNMSKGNKY